jgi:hypothetical protein
MGGFVALYVPLASVVSIGAVVPGSDLYSASTGINVDDTFSANPVPQPM